MSPVERSTIWRKGWDMANVYRNHPGDLYPPGVEDANGQGQEGTVTSTPLQGTQDPIPNDPQVDADEIGPSRGLQPRLPEDISDASHSESTARPKVGARAVSAAEQHSRTNSGPAGTIQLGQTPPAPWVQLPESSEKLI
ncbi:hypothetical protein BC629DRAFT_1551468 [Irpex lacteus]|nr:hypothetical protein BC629DRAFT_1551468 [Irpex lacteus]